MLAMERKIKFLEYKMFRMNSDMKDKNFGLSFKSFVILHKHIKELITIIKFGKKDEEIFQYVKKMFVTN